jgi:hypothetical protein
LDFPVSTATFAGRNYVRGHHAELGDLYAAWDPCSHHVEPAVRPSRFGARLAPFKSREEAERALIAEGAVIEPEAVR